VRGDLLRLQRLRLEVRFYRNLKALLSGWRLLHAGLATFLVIIIAGHIGLSLYLGFGWIFF
jgi:dihydropyrimidine dehydrogenase (NAD+) subunit PreT